MHSFLPYFCNCNTWSARRATGSHYSHIRSKYIIQNFNMIRYKLMRDDANSYRFLSLCSSLFPYSLSEWMNEWTVSHWMNVPMGKIYDTYILKICFILLCFWSLHCHLWTCIKYKYANTKNNYDDDNNNNNKKLN